MRRFSFMCSILLLGGLLSLPASPGYPLPGNPSPGNPLLLFATGRCNGSSQRVCGVSRSESQVSLWLEKSGAVPGPGAEELTQGVQKFRTGDWGGAAAILMEAARRGAGGPVEESAVYLIGECRARSAVSPQDVRAAIKDLQDARRKFPGSQRASWALWRSGSLYRRLGFDYEAIATFEQVLRREPAESSLAPFIRLDLAEAYVAQHRFKEAVLLFRSVLQKSQDDESQSEATIGLGDVSHALSLYSQARDLYVQAEAKWPHLLRSRPASLLAMGETFLKLGDWPRAHRVLSAGYNLHPRDEAAPLMLIRLAEGYRLAGQPRQARTHYATVLERHPGSEGEALAWEGLGALAEEEAGADARAKAAQAAYYYQMIVARWNERPIAAEALFRLGRSYQRIGASEAAAAAYDQLLVRSDAASWRGRARQALEATLRALMEEGKALDVANLFFRHDSLLMTPPIDGATGLALADALDRFGLVDSSVQVYGAVLSGKAAGPHRERALAGLAEAYRKKGDLSHAEEAWQEYLHKYPRGRWSRDAQQGLIDALIKSNKRSDAERFCRRWLAIGSLTYKPDGGSAGAGPPGAVLSCADLLLQMGQTRTAMGLYEGVAQGAADSADSLWASYQIGRGHVLMERFAQAAEFFGRVAKTEKDPLLAAAAAAQLAALGFQERP